MKSEKLAEAIRLAKKAGFVLVGLTDDKGMPHITAAGRLNTTSDSAVAITEWFCQGMVATLQKTNPYR
jgi:hypothetical protein